ncbi:MAG: SpoIIE family protein phosphatase [Salinibacterium sp.]|nr:SpoIIE family protein phosphatase [Salinibacterium sp.]
MPEAAEYSLRIKTPPDDVNLVHELLETVWGASPEIPVEERNRFETALIELASNVIRHSSSSAAVSCVLSIRSSPGHLEAELRDTADPGDVELVGRMMPDELAESGRGIPLIQALVDELEYSHDGSFNLWRITRTFPFMTLETTHRTGSTPISISGLIDEVARQRALDDLGIVGTPPEERFDRVTRLAKQLFGVESAAISLIDHDRQWFKSRQGIADPEMPREVAFCDITIQRPETFSVSNALEDPRFADNPLVTGNPNIRFYAGHPLVASTGERVGALCVFDPNPRVFSEAETALLRDLALWVQNELTVAKELDRAVEVQRSLLPRSLVSLPGYEVAGECVPARAVGGDFYDWYPVGEGAVFTLADVMGKGIGSAIIAATVRAVLRSGLRNQNIAMTLDAATATLSTDLDEAGTFVTLFHSRLDMDTGELRYVDAGHGISFIVRAGGGMTRLATTNFPLGSGLDEEWEERIVTIDPGDTLVLISDGVLDLFDGALTSLASVEQMVRDADTASAFVEAIVRKTGDQAEDDVTIVAVRRNAD